MTQFDLSNVRGRLTYSNLTMARAVVANDNPKRKFKTPADKIAPDFQLLLTQPQVEKLVTHLVDEFIPEAVARHKAGEKKNVLDPKRADKAKTYFAAGLAGGPEAWDEPPYMPLRNVYTKSLDLMPEAWATFKASGSAGRDIELLAKVMEESQLKVPDDTARVYPLLAPIHETQFEMYPGSRVFATARFFAYDSGPGTWGINAYANQLVFVGDADRFGGGAVDVDAEGVFMDDDED